MNDKDETPTVYVTFDEAPDPNVLHVGYDATGRKVWKRFTPYRFDSQRVAELAAQMRAGQWELPGLDEGSAQAAGPDYANRNRFMNPGPVSREEALRIIHEAIDVARSRGWSNRPWRLPAGFPRAQAALGARRSYGGGKTNGIAGMLAEVARAGRVSYVVDPQHYLNNIVWPTQKAQPEDLVDRIDQVVADAERLIASVRSANRTQRNRDDWLRMFGDQR